MVVMGMGAFAIENARTALSSGARHVTIVTRSLNTVVPRLIGYLTFITNGKIQSSGKSKQIRDEATAKQYAWVRRLWTLASRLESAINAWAVAFTYHACNAVASCPRRVREQVPFDVSNYRLLHTAV